MAPPRDNSHDVDLLRSDPQKLILQHTRDVRFIVKKYITLGMFHRSEYEDIVQSVFESLFRKIPSIQRQYNGSSLFVTYLSSIVRNICLTFRDHPSRRIKTSELQEIATEDPEPTYDLKLIDQVLDRLKIILTLYDKKLPKVLLSLKLKFRIPLTDGDIRTWYPASSAGDRARFVRAFGGFYEEMRDPELFRKAAPMLNKVEGRENRPDSLRRYVDTTIREILVLLNGNPPRHTFDEDSLGALIQKYFFRI